MRQADAAVAAAAPAIDHRAVMFGIKKYGRPGGRGERAPAQLPTAFSVNVTSSSFASLGGFFAVVVKVTVSPGARSAFSTLNTQSNSH